MERRLFRRCFAYAAAMLLAAPISLHAQAAIRVGWQPEQPRQGSLFRILVSSETSRLVDATGTVAGEALHFQMRDDGTLAAIAGLPVDAADSLELQLVVRRESGGREQIRVWVPVAPGDFQHERLTVAPRYGTPPDSATAARIRREQEKAMAVSARSHQTPPLWSDVIAPRESRITSGFGNGREFNGQIQSRHMGTDFAGAPGSPVRAAARGLVALVDTFHLAGNVIYIDHGAGLVSAYFHLSRQEVAQGDTVQAGQIIGRVGATGRVTGPHLHWVVRYGRISVDPTSLLAIAAADVAVQPPREAR